MKVRKDAMVIVSLYSMGRNPNLFERPDSYLPERWLEGGLHGQAGEGRGESKGEAKDASGAFIKTRAIHRTHEYTMPVFWGEPRERDRET